jgi:ADP-ribose pyrophosphatase
VPVTRDAGGHLSDATDDATLLGRRVIHRGRIISVDEDHVRFPDGSTGTLDVVRHPGAAAILPFLGEPAGGDPAILMIRQFRHAVRAWLLEVPAGRLDPGESPEACARRELMEETGCTAAELVRLTTIVTTPGFSDEAIHLFMASGLERGKTRHEADEFIELVTVPLSEALDRIRTGDIRDAKSVVALLYAAGFVAGR